MRLGSVMLVLFSSGCGSALDSASGATDDFIDMDTPPGQCSAGTSAAPCPDPGSTGSPEGGPCIDSQDCAGDNACVAPFSGGEVGAFICTSECIPPMDESAWCLDASACCGQGVACSARGLCVPEVALDSSGSDTQGSSTSSGSSDSSGSSSSGSGSSGSGSSGPASSSGTAG